MTDARRPEAGGGYRGALPPRHDALARPWVLAVLAIFLLMFVLTLAGYPSKLFVEPTPGPTPSFSLAPSGSAAPSASGSEEPAEPSASP